MDEQKLQDAKMEAEAKAMQQGVVMGMASRESGRMILRQRISQLTRQAKLLEALDRALPLELPPDAEEALWELVIQLRR